MSKRSGENIGCKGNVLGDGDKITGSETRFNSTRLPTRFPFSPFTKTWRQTFQVENPVFFAAPGTHRTPSLFPCLCPTKRRC